MINEDYLMRTVTRRSKMFMFWGNLSEEEADLLVFLFERRRAWYRAWNMALEGTKKYGHPHHQPGITCFLPEWQLVMTEYLSRKGWGIEVKEQV